MFGLIECNDINKFKANIIEYLKDRNILKIDYGINNNTLYFSKKTKPNWLNKMIYHDNINNMLECNIKYYRITIKNIYLNTYYFESNGITNLLDYLEKNVDFIQFDIKKWCIINKNNKNYIDLINTIHKYILNEDDFKQFINDIKKIPNIENLQLDENLSYYISKFEKIEEVQDNLKLIPYIKNECLDTNNKSSETKYNINVCKDNKYINLDRKIIDTVEIADLYDKDNKCYYHNKKIGDLRSLGFQIINGVLCILDENKFTEYKKINIKKDIQINNIINKDFFFIAGLIDDKKKEKKNNINYKDKIVLGIVYDMLIKKNIKFYINIIEYKEN